MLYIMFGVKKEMNMNNIITAVESVKSYFFEKSNKIYIVFLIGFSLIAYSQYIIMKKIDRLAADAAKNNKQITNISDDIKKKIDHRYFNITRTLEDCFEVNVDTYNGAVTIRRKTN